jgi:hypothetical protein
MREGGRKKYERERDTRSTGHTHTAESLHGLGALAVPPNLDDLVEGADL